MKASDLREIAKRAQVLDANGASPNSAHPRIARRWTRSDYFFWGFVGLCLMSATVSLLHALEAPEVRQARLAEEARQEQIRVVERQHAEAEAANRAKEDAKKARLDICSGAEIKAFTVSQEALRSRLKSPSTASFPWLPILSQHTGDCKFRVLAYVDAQNGFGALIRSNYVANLTYNPETKAWRVTSMTLD